MEELEHCIASLDGSALPELLASARSALVTIKQELNIQKQAAEARQKTVQDWQAIASERETEAVRLRAEINRMRQALATSSQTHESQAAEIANLQTQLQEALAINKVHQRQAVVTTSAVDGPNAELHRLRAELEGRTAQLQRAEADLANQTSAAAVRLQELQETFSNKIGDMRRLHQQQLEQAVAAARAAAASEAQGRTGPRAGAAAVEQQNAQKLQKAEAEAVALRQQLEAAQVSGRDLQQKLKQAQSDADSNRSQLTSTQFNEKALKARIKDLESQLAKAQQQKEQHQKEVPPPPPPPGAKEAPAVDMNMLSMMESQLGRLSEIIRSREAELGQMRVALQAGLDERRELLNQVESLQAALLQAQQQQQHVYLQQQQHGSAPGTSNSSINGSMGGGSASGMSSPKSASGAVPRGLPQVVQNKPHRTGLQSKPRFFK